MNNLCTIFEEIDTQLVVKPNNAEFDSDKFPSFNNFCPLTDGGKKQQCNKYEEMVISAFITFLVSFISSNDYGYLDTDKLAEYAILWLCYKLNQNTENTIDNLNKFYNNHIKGIEKYVKTSKFAETYNSCMNVINKKQDLMNMDIKETSKLYEALKFLCKLYTGCDEKKGNYTNCSKDAHDFASNFENLNQDSRIIGNNSYIEILSNLFNDYKNFKNDCAKKCSKCSDIPTLIYIKVPKSSAQDQAESSGVTSSSSSIAKTLIPALLIFTIPIFLGVAYKYSLFGFDKRVQRKHLREKLKK